METKEFTSFLDHQLFNNRTILVNGPVDSQLAETINRQLLALDLSAPDKPITMMINSPGGEVHSGFSIFDTAKFIRPKLITIVSGLAASMGSVLALCASKENRYAFPNARLLIHQPLIGGVIRGQASDIDIHAKDIIKTRQQINELYAKETGKSVEEIAKLTDRDYWLTAEDALKLGLISKIIQKASELK
jgi:ATP-dependent Clp protease protease subunit